MQLLVPGRRGSGASDRKVMLLRPRKAQIESVSKHLKTCGRRHAPTRLRAPQLLAFDRNFTLNPNLNLSHSHSHSHEISDIPTPYPPLLCIPIPIPKPKRLKKNAPPSLSHHHLLSPQTSQAYQTPPTTKTFPSVHFISYTHNATPFFFSDFFFVLLLLP